MSTASPIRFRCFRCGKLLGVSRSKAGAVVSCPGCSVELQVPEPSDAPEASKDPTPPLLRDSTPDMPPALLDSGTTAPPRSSSSGSRIEPVVVPWDAHPEPEPDPLPGPVFPAIQTEGLTLRTEPLPRSKGAARAKSDAALEPVILPNLVVVEEPSLREAIALPAVASSASSSLRATGARRDDVVLPRSAVVLWSFAVLIGLALAFAAGLLAGRFVWAPRAGGTRVTASPSAGLGQIASEARQADCTSASLKV
jgi:hypothetical protein